MEDKTIEIHDFDGNPAKVRVSEMTFRPSVYGVIIKDGKILLTRYKDEYDFPGGGVDIGERIVDACKREVLEETGVMVDVGEVLYAQDDFFTHPVTKKHHHTILLFYRCINPQGEITTDMFDESDHKLGTLQAVWLPVEDAYKAKFYNPIDSPALIRKVVESI